MAGTRVGAKPAKETPDSAFTDTNPLSLFYLIKPRPLDVVRVNWLCLKVIGALME